jgi:hypothetical protein
MLAQLLVLFTSFFVAFATTGVDLSQYTPLSAFQCAKSYGCKLLFKLESFRKRFLELIIIV